MQFQFGRKVMSFFRSPHGIKAISFGFCLVVGCGDKGGGGGDSGPELPSGAQPEQTATTQPTGESNSTAGRLSLGYNNVTTPESLPESYALAEGIDVPSAQDSFNSSLPSDMQAAAPQVGLVTSSDDYPLIPPPLNLAKMGLSSASAAEKAFYDAFIYSCRSTTTNTDSPNGAQDCIDAMNNDTYGDEYAFVVGPWDRYFDGQGPTDIRKMLEGADNTFAKIEADYVAGKLRCLVGDHHQFTVDFPTGISGFEDGVAFDLACIEKGDYSIAHGYKDGYFYQWHKNETGYGVRLLKVKDDGKDMEVWVTRGAPGSENSTGLVHFRSWTDDDGNKLFAMNPTGRGIGPTCGTYMAFKTSPSGESNMFWNLRGVVPGANGDPDDCKPANASTDQYCVDKDFNLVDLSVCTAAGLDTPVFDLYSEETITNPDTSAYENKASYLSTFGRAYNNVDGLTFDSLWAQEAIVDPLFAVNQNLFANGAITSLIEKFNDTVSHSQSLVKDGDRRCSYEAGQAWDPGAVASKTSKKLFMNCKTSETTFGYVNDRWNIYQYRETGQNNEILFGQADDLDIEIWKMHFPASGFTNWNNSEDQAYVMQLSIRPQASEAAVFGSSGGIGALHCGAQIRKIGNLVYARGRFTSGECDKTFEDEDCLQLGDDNKFTRLPLSECFTDENANVTAFSLKPLNKTSFAANDVLAMAAQPGPDVRDYEDQLEEGEEPPRSENITPGWTQRGALPVTINVSRMKASSVVLPPVSSNCFYRPGNQSRTLHAAFAIELASLAPEKLASLQAAAKLNKAWVAYQMAVQSYTTGSATVNQTIAGSMSFKDINGEGKTMTVNTHTENGAYVISGLLPETVVGNERLELVLQGQVSLDCPGTPSPTDRASMRFLVRDPNIRY